MEAVNGRSGMYVKQTRLKNGTINVSIVEAYWQDGRSR
jgi:hypothetical protein